jgi:glycosyltransferase involved in cell wall biosynthesis
LSRQRDYDVAFYLPSLGRRLALHDHSGGAETQVLLVSRALAERGLRVCVIVFDTPGFDIPSRIDGVDVVLRPPPSNNGRLIGRFREVAAVGKSVLGVHASVVVTRCAGPNVGLVCFWAKLARVRFVYSSAHDLDFNYEALLPHRHHRALYRLGVALADGIVVQTEEQLRLCQLKFRRTPRVIRSVSEPAELADCQPEAFLWIGRLDPIKKPLEFVRLAQSLPGARFWMVRAPSGDPLGGARLARVVEQAARRLPNLELFEPCPRSELLALMQRAVAVVSTSGSEGMPNIFLEAWSRGIPALALHHDPDGIISRYRLGGFAHGSRQRLAELALQLWAGRSAGRWARCQAYVRTNHSPDVIGVEWGDALRTVGHRPLQSLVVEASSR